MTKRICFLGAHGVGKSTTVFLKAYIEKSSNPSLSVSICSEGIRRIGRGDKELIKKMLVDDAFPMEWIHRWFTESKLAERTSDIVIYDRHALDAYPYAFFNTPDAVDDLVSLLPVMIKDLTKFDEIYFIIPPEFDVADDGIRNTDKEYQHKVSMKYAEILHKEWLLYDRIVYSSASDLKTKWLKEMV